MSQSTAAAMKTLPREDQPEPQPLLQEELERNDLTKGHNWYSALLNRDFALKVAFRDDKRAYSYGDIAAAAYANHLRLEEDFKVEKTIKSKKKTLHGKRIGIFTSHNASFVVSLWSK